MTGEQKPGGLEVVAWAFKHDRDDKAVWLGAERPVHWDEDQGVALTPAEPAEARIRELERQLRIVQNAAKTLHHCRDTELQHLRENATFDHRLRAEHESLMERDAMMTDLLEQAEARATAAEARNAELSMLAYRWMEAHDRLKAGENYDLPSPADLPAAEAQLAKAKEALEWYGEQARLARLVHSEGDAGRHALAGDGGKRAASVLAALQQAGEVG